MTAAPHPPASKHPWVASLVAIAMLHGVAHADAPFDPATCGVEVPAAAAAGPKLPDVTWRDFDVEGQLADSAETVRALFAPTVNRHAPSLTDEARADLAKTAAAFGYELVGLATRETASGTHLVLQLAPLPLVRVVDRPNVNSPETFWTRLFSTQFADEIVRRLHVRVGSYLKWKPHDRRCQLEDERQHVEEYLRDEGFFDARAKIAESPDGSGVRISARVDLGPEYETGTVSVANPGALAVNEVDIRQLFVHRKCLFNKYICRGYRRFTAAQHKEDLVAVAKLFKRAGYPSVRVTDDFDPKTKTSYDRRTKLVNFTVSIDQRRHVDVVFEGNDPDSIHDSDLRDKLTFDEAGSSDDVEAEASAKAITGFLQERGFFDAHVTWTRERFPELDRIIYRIDQGGGREVKAIGFVGNRSISDGTLADAIATHAAQFTASLFGGSAAASSTQLAADTGRIIDVYRRAGFREARVRVSVATEPDALDSVALTAALVSADRGGGNLYVRFTIDEGIPTLVSQLEVDVTGKGAALATEDDRALCDLALKELAELLDARPLATRETQGACTASAPDLKYREDDVDDSKDRLRERLWAKGRPRAKVELAHREVGAHRVGLRYKITDTELLKIGKVVVRGNFRTRDSVIRLDILDQLGFVEGAPLTTDTLAEAARQLRATGLFDAVNIDLPNLDETTSGEVNAIVRVQERFDRLATIDLEAGFSTYSGVFTKLGPSFKNLFGTGLSLDLAGTIGLDYTKLVDQQILALKQLAIEGDLKVPSYLVRDYVPLHPNLQAELNVYHRLQDTPRFGPVTTEGATLAATHTWSRQRVGSEPARAITLGVHYDFRLLERQVDVLRPLGADDDETQVPISTRTGSVGVTFEYEQRTDRRGSLSPLSPEAGVRLEAQLAVASVYLLGQDNFLKFSTSGSKYWPIGNNLVLRADLRYDQGFPLGNAVLLPEVERFFAGGDATVRGYDDDRLATEILKVGVPPLDNVQQLRILPAGGDIRVMASVDAQLRIYKFLATAVFTDAGMITNEWSTFAARDIRPSVGVALVRVVTPFGAFAVERAVPIHPELGDDPRGRWHISFAARAQF